VVNLTSPTASGTLTVTPSASQTTPSNGIVAFTLVSTAAGTFPVTVVADPTGQNVPLSSPTQAVWQNATASAATSTVYATPTSVVANGSSATTVFVTLLTAGSQPVPGKNVTLNISAPSVASLIVTPATATSNAQGVAAFTVASTIAQTAVFTATDTTDGVSVTIVAAGQSNIVVYTSGTGISPTLSTASANPTSVPADGTSISTISVNVKNVGGQNIAAATVFIFGSPTNGVVVDALSKTTDGNGNTSFQVRSTVAQTVTFTLQVQSSQGNAQIANQPQVTFTTSTSSGVVCSSSTASLNYSSIPADGSTTASLTVTLHNSSNQGVSGQTITVTTGSSGVSISPASAVTDTNGASAFNVKSSSSGSVSGGVTLNVTGGGCSFTPSITFTAAGTSPNATGTSTTGAGATATPSGAAAAVINLIQPPNAGPATGRVIAYRLRVRTGPGLTYHILGLLKLGTTVVLTARNPRGSWFQIQIPNGTAFVSAYYIRVKRLPYRHLPIIEIFPPAPNNNNTPSVIAH
ncbi:MAG TPA: SH3 domain-containing protein, partial [Aggregatilineales bacterium]|nr:SH3 domain-containing protein [Aggregatilineales bacterium]